MAVSQPYNTPEKSGVLAPKLLMPVFAATLCLSAFLLFSIQPFFTKLLLPRLGGSPAVWSVAMVFFQGVLLLGYAYAHLVAKRCSVSTGVLLHLVVLLSAFFFLPISVPPGWETPPATGQELWLLGLLTSSVGLPFFAVSANGALLQAWFARSQHPQSADPYFLYGASNIGSFASLILYIVMIEPLLTLPMQAMSWTISYAALVAMIAASGWLVISGGIRAPSVIHNTAHKEVAVGWRRVVTWIALGFIPSGLLVATTAHITTDIAAAPFLWVAPLALFLLTFVLAFRSRPVVSPQTLSRILFVFASLVLLSLLVALDVPVWVSLLLHLIFFFAAALYCHSILYSLRPAADGLTGFYLAMSFGGVLGGAFASLAAPFLFSWIAEYPILVVAVMLVRPAETGQSVIDWRWLAAAIGLVFLTPLGAPLVEHLDGILGRLVLLLLVLLVAMLIAQFRWPRAYLRLLCLILPLVFLANSVGKELFRERSFFGIVEVGIAADGKHHVMRHGTTMHGAESLADWRPGAERPTPLSYFHPGGGIAKTIHMTQAVRPQNGNYAIVGLGAGSVACYAQPGEKWSFFEIDKSVITAASDPRLFRYLSECGAAIDIVTGDARLTLAQQPANLLDYLLIDAFSSDSIPTHLITREAIEMYKTKLKPDGVLAFHISNRYLELESVLAAIGRETDMPVRVGYFMADPHRAMTNRLIVGVMTNNIPMLAALNADPRWTTPEAGATAAWTDDYSNVFSALVRKQIGPDVWAKIPNAASH